MKMLQSNSVISHAGGRMPVGSTVASVTLCVRVSMEVVPHALILRSKSQMSRSCDIATPAANLIFDILT